MIKSKTKGSELFMVLAAVGILMILFVPISSSMLDLLLICNFSWALSILLLTFYTDKPLSFSTFPTLLLISTLFRLALNISATRLILSNGDAGRVIQTMGQYVIHGNYVMGLVVFLILIIVQFVVVTNGAQRVAEVAARFTLDSMPGKQMSIDADLNMGLISQDDAKTRRSQLEREANFYGAMDGASKFVKGDAIAGILIVLVNILGGFAIGMAQKGLSLGDAIQTYTLLTVGDGLVTQIPALIISVATGIIVTRAATDAALGSEVARQIAAYPITLGMVALSLVGLLALKGIPALPVLAVLSVIIISITFAIKSQKELAAAPEDESIYDKIRIYPVELQLNSELYQELKPFEFQLIEQIELLRERIAFDLGFVLPEIKIRPEKKLNYPFYGITIQGNPVSGYHQLHLDKVLALQTSSEKDTSIDGIAVVDPGYGLPASWIDKDKASIAQQRGLLVHEPITVLMTHFNELMMQHLPELLSRDETEKLLNQSSIKKLAEELIPAVLTLSQMQRILQSLLEEKVSIRYLMQIMDVLHEHAKQAPDPQQLTEMIRAKLALPICQRLVNEQNKLYVLTLESKLEQQLNQSIHQNHWSAAPELTETLLTGLIKQVEKMILDRKRPVLLCSALLRRHLKQLTHRILPHLTVLGMNEIPVNIQVESFGIIK